MFEFIQNNPLVAGAASLGVSGLFAMWLKNIPVTLYNFIKRNVTTTLYVTSNNISFIHILNWLEENYKSQNLRTLKLKNGITGWDGKTITSIGYGFHFLKYKNKYLIVRMTRTDASKDSFKESEEITITVFGRSRAILDSIVVETYPKDRNNIKIYKFGDKGWEFAKSLKTRGLGTIYVESSIKEELTRKLKIFNTKEDWYIEHGIPYQLGILLYGPPGTGKTSIIKAIASYLNYPIYYMSPKKLKDK
jgi:chaperone BCS1